MQLPSFAIPFFDAMLEKLNPFVEYLSANPNANHAFIVLLLALVALLFLSLSRKKPLQTANLTHVNPQDINAIAGDDVIATQLDLAKAYIEMNQKKIAKDMLNTIVKIGSNHQKSEARLLIQSL